MTSPDDIPAVLDEENLPDLPVALPAPVFVFPPIAGFWRRFFAWLVDGILLGILGQAIGWPFSSFWFQVGPYGRIVGLLIMLLYFGLFNSKVGNGQTLGKRLFKIAVRGSDNQLLGIGRSLLRTLVLVLPAIVNGWSLPILQNWVSSWLITIILFGGGAALLYTMVFNRRARQGLHDLICDSYVVYLEGGPIEAFPKTAKVHQIIASVLIGLVILLATVGYLIVPLFTAPPSLATTAGPYQTLQADNRFFTVSLSETTAYSTQSASKRILLIEVWYRGLPASDEYDVIMNEIAQVALNQIDHIETYDLMRISIRSGFDLSIATGNFTSGFGGTIDEWQERIDTPVP